MKKTFIFDTETTGLINFELAADDPLQPRMCTFAGCIVEEDGSVSRSVYLSVNTDHWDASTFENCAQAFAMNKLSIDMLNATGVPISKVLDVVDDMTDECDSIAGYSLAFDQKIIRGEQRRAGRPDRYKTKPEADIMWDANPLTKIPKPNGKKGFKLPTLSEAARILLGETHEGAHGAKADLDMTVKLFNHLRRGGNIKWREFTAD